MYLKKIHIDHFGSLRARDLTFAPGMNLIEGENESGKSTVSTFLLFILYGLDKTARTRYTNWDTGLMGGYAELNKDGEDYRIEREIRASRESVRMIRLSDNTVCFQNQCPGEVFLGVPEPLFTRVAYISQSGGSTVEGKSVLAAIENLLFSGDESLSTQKAQKKLDEARIALLHKNKKGGRVYELEQECAKLETDLICATKDQTAIIAKEGTLTDWRNKQQENRSDLAQVQDKLHLYRAQKACENFDRLSALRAQEAELDRYRADLEAEHTHNGFLPDYLYVNELERLCREEEIYRRQNELASEELHTAESRESDVAQRQHKIDLITARGGTETVLCDIQTLQKKQKTRRIWGWILIWLLPLGLFLLSRAKKIKEQYLKLLGELEIDPAQDPIQALRDRARDAEILRDYYAAIAARRETYTSQNSQMQAADASLRDFLARWGQDDAKTALETARQYLGEKEKLTLAKQECTHTQQLCLAYVEGTEETARQEMQELVSRGVTVEESELPELERRRNFLEKQQISLQEGVHKTELELTQLHTAAQQPATLAEQLRCVRAESGRLQRRHDALLLAEERMETAAACLRESISPRLSARAGELMSQMTSGKYGVIGVSSTLSLAYTEHGEDGSVRTHDISCLSAGTEDLAYISLRLALADLLFTAGGAPFIFDESFSRLDDTRLSNILTLLSESCIHDQRQIILLSSSHRDVALLGDRPFHFIQL